MYLTPIEMPMGPLPNTSPISNLGTTLSSTKFLKCNTIAGWAVAEGLQQVVSARYGRVTAYRPYTVVSFLCAHTCCEQRAPVDTGGVWKAGR